MRSGIRHYSKGFSTLLFTLVVLLAVTVASFISASSVTTRQYAILQNFQHTTAFQAAQAGLDYSVPYLTDNYETIADGASVIVNLSDGNYFNLVFTFIDGKDLIRVESTGYSGDGSSSHKIEHLVKYTTSEELLTTTYAMQSRGDVDMVNNSDVSDLTGSLYTAKIGGGLSLSNSASTTLDTGVASTRGNIGADVIQNDVDVAAQTDTEMELGFLGAEFSEFQDETATLILPPQTGDYDYQNDIAGMSGTSILITHSGGSANFQSHSTIGTTSDPVVLIVNLDGVPGTNFFIGNETEVNGKVVVNNGPLDVDNGATINGTLVVQGDVLLGNNVTVNGDVITTGNFSMRNNATINGAVFALGKIELANFAEVHGAIISGDEIEIANNVQIMYNPANASIIIPNKSGTAGYAKISGSWTDLSP